MHHVMLLINSTSNIICLLYSNNIPWKPTKQRIPLMVDLLVSPSSSSSSSFTYGVATRRKAASFVSEVTKVEEMGF